MAGPLGHSAPVGEYLVAIDYLGSQLSSSSEVDRKGGHWGHPKVVVKAQVMHSGLNNPFQQQTPEGKYLHHSCH